MTGARGGALCGAFTLIELLVVISIVALLIAILLPTLRHARASAMSIQCQSQVRQIHLAISMYASDVDDFIHPRRNRGRWFDGPVANNIRIRSSSILSYWGVAYEQYLGGAPGGMKLFNCPSASDADWPPADGTFASGAIYHTYGFNGVAPPYKPSTIAGEAPFFDYRGAINYDNMPPRRLVEMKQPSSLVMFQDAYEDMFDGNGDMPYNLYQWVGSQGDEYFRHLNATTNIMWTDGHSSSMRRDGEWDMNWYFN